MSRFRRAARALLFISACLALVVSMGSLIPRQPALEGESEVIFEDDRLRVTLDGVVDALNPLYVRDGVIYAMEDHYLYVSADGGRTFQQRGRLPKVDPSWTDAMKNSLARNRWVRHVRKNRRIGNLAVLSTGTIIVVYDQIYRSTDGGVTFESVYRYPKGVVPPFMAGLAVTPEDEIYFGEYDAVSRPHPISVMKGEGDGREWQEVYRFPSGQIFHVHSITHDPIRDRLLIATGDLDDESHVYATADGFQTVEEIGGGSQDWRVVSMAITRDALYWGSDNDQTGAGIYRWDIAARQLEKQAFIGPPSYFSTTLADGTMAISTAFEPRSHFTKSAKPSPEIALWVSRRGQQWTKILSYDSVAKENPDDPTRASFFLPDGDQSLDVLVGTSNYTLQRDFALHRMTIEWLD